MFFFLATAYEHMCCIASGPERALWLSCACTGFPHPSAHVRDFPYLPKTAVREAPFLVLVWKVTCADVRMGSVRRHVCACAIMAVPGKCDANSAVD